LLQPVTKEMGEMFEEFKTSSICFIEDAMEEAHKKFNRYVRKTLDLEQYRADYAQWHTEFEAFQKENPSYPSCDEVYGRVIKKRKRVKGILQFEGNLSVMENGMQIETVERKDPMEVVKFLNKTFLIHIVLKMNDFHPLT
jgi:hypothetical protein